MSSESKDHAGAGALIAGVDPLDHARGAAGARLTIVTYGDYECPFTARSESALRFFERQLAGQLRLVFRNFPLTRLHPHAQLASEIAEAAAARDVYWPVHDTIFASQRAGLDRGRLLAIAGAHGIDVVDLRGELAAGKWQARVARDVAMGHANGVHRTPTLFANGVRHPGDSDLASLTAFIEAAWEKASGGSAPAG